MRPISPAGLISPSPRGESGPARCHNTPLLSRKFSKKNIQGTFPPPPFTPQSPSVPPTAAGGSPPLPRTFFSPSPFSPPHTLNFTTEDRPVHASPARSLCPQSFTGASASSPASGVPSSSHSGLRRCHELPLRAATPLFPSLCPDGDVSLHLGWRARGEAGAEAFSAAPHTRRQTILSWRLTPSPAREHRATAGQWSSVYRHCKLLSSASSSEVQGLVYTARRPRETAPKIRSHRQKWLENGRFLHYTPDGAFVLSTVLAPP